MLVVGLEFELIAFVFLPAVLPGHFAFLFFVEHFAEYLSLFPSYVV